MRGLSYRGAQIAGRIAVVVVVVVLIVTMRLLKGRSHAVADQGRQTHVTETKAPEKSHRSAKGVNDSDVASLLGSHHDDRYQRHIGYMPHGGNHLRYKAIGSYSAVFNDLNPVHLAAARAIGFQPLNDLRRTWHMKRPVVKVKSNADYFVDTLHHSLPYLVPEAEQLLTDIGRRFREALQERGGGDYRIKVTSLLRTPATVAKLRRINRNSTSSSAHQYGTTFDISYVRFICDNPRTPRTADDLKGLLAEVLNDMRAKGRCYVKYERRQGCFHITVRR